VIEVNLYEHIDYERSNKYDRYHHLVDPFVTMVVKIRSKENKIIHRANNRRIIHKLDNRLTEIDKKSGYHFIELKIKEKSKYEFTDNFILNRFILSWGTNSYFLKKYETSVEIIDDDVFVFKCKLISIVREDELGIKINQILRNRTLDILLK